MTTSQSTDSPKTGQELIQDVVSDERTVSLDELLDRDPHKQRITDEELLAHIKAMRLERAGIEAKIEKRKEKKANEKAD